MHQKDSKTPDVSCHGGRGGRAKLQGLRPSPLMGLLQDFSINGLEESGHHSPLRESMFIKGEGVLKKSHWEKKGEGGTWPQKGRGKDR